MINAPIPQAPISLKEILNALDNVDINFFKTKQALLQQFIQKNPQEMGQVLCAIFEKCPHKISVTQAIFLVFLCYELKLDFSELTITYQLAKQVNFIDDKKTPVFVAMLVCNLPWFAANEFEEIVDHESSRSKYTYENDKAEQYREHQKIYNMLFKDYHVSLEKVKEIITDLLFLASINQFSANVHNILNFERPSSSFTLRRREMQSSATLNLTGGRPTTAINTFAGVNRTTDIHVPISDSGAAAYIQQQMLTGLTAAHFAPVVQAPQDAIPEVLIQEANEHRKREREKETAELEKKERKLDAIAKVDNPFVSLDLNGQTLANQLISAGNLAALSWVLDTFPSLLKTLKGQALYDITADLALDDEAIYEPIKAFLKTRFSVKEQEQAKPIIFSDLKIDIKQSLHIKLLLPLLIPGKEKLFEKYFNNKLNIDERPLYYNALAELVENQPSKKAILERIRQNLMQEKTSSIKCEM